VCSSTSLSSATNNLKSCGGCLRSIWVLRCLCVTPPRLAAATCCSIHAEACQSPSHAFCVASRANTAPLLRFCSGVTHHLSPPAGCCIGLHHRV
jgi:hypothetical protein